MEVQVIHSQQTMSSREIAEVRSITGFDRYTIDSNGVVYSLYFVSRTGRITQRDLPKKLAIAVDNYGYGVVTLYSDDDKRTCKVHRLVAEAFLEANTSRNQVNHKNGQKLDNKISNLEWCTPSENQLHSYHTLNRAPSRPWLGQSNKSISIPVSAMDCASGKESFFPSIKACCLSKSISKSSITKHIDTGIPVKGLLIRKAYAIPITFGSPACATS